MINCISARKWLPTLESVENEGDLKRRALLEAHLGQCPDCRTYQAELQRLRRIVMRSGEVEFPAEYLEDFTARLARRIESEGIRAEAAGPRAQYRTARTWIVIIAEAVAGLVFWVIAPSVLLSSSIGHFHMVSMPAVFLLSLGVVSAGLAMGLLITIQVSRSALEPERSGTVQYGLFQ